MYAIFLLVILDTPNLLVGNYANTLTVTQALEIIFMIVAGVSNPKLTTFLLKEMPEDKQTSIFSIYGTIVTLTVPLGTIIFTFLSNVIGNMFTISILLAVLVFSLLYTYTFILNEKQKYSPKI